MKLTEHELSNNQLDPQTLHNAIQQIRNNGYILFEGVLAADLVKDMCSTFMQTFERYVASTDSNRGTKRYQMHVPFTAPFTDERVITSPLVLPVVDALLGSDCICHYFASDTPMPGSEYQDTHADIFPLFPETPSLIMPPYSIVVNIPLVDHRADNGPLEIWPGGTHHYVADRSEVPALAAQMHSEHVLMPAGSILIRDSRMWHRGTPNRGNAPRPNFALIYSRYWLRLRYPPIAIPQETYDGLSERGKQLFRLENIGASAISY
jgi:ectoine hydroxylase-related dioxygenase (phytanoyl-CoA dioxygenase family)